MADNGLETLQQRLDKYKTTPTVPVQQAPVQETVPSAGLTTLQERLNKYKPAPVAQTPTEVTAPEDMSQQVYSESNLVEDKFFQPIQEYMIDRFGTHMRDQSRDEVVSQFVNNMRGFAGGNSVRALSEVAYLNGVSDNPESMIKAGQAYELFENMQGFGGETSWGEAGAMVWDYTRGAVLDPVNLLGLGIGKVASGTGFKAGSQVALFAARQEYKKALATKLASGVAKNVAEKEANEVAAKAFGAAGANATAMVNQKIAQRQAIERAATTTFQRMTSKTALKEGALTGVFEGAVSAGTDYLYQDAMLRTKVQEEYNVYQTGLAGVVGLVAGGLSAMASNVRTGASGLVAPTPFKTSTKGATVVSGLVNQTATVVPGGTASPPMGNWLKDTAKGVELRDQDSEFFVKMLLGDNDKGLKGLVNILAEDGYGWIPRDTADTISNWVGDIIKESDPQDAMKFMDDFTKATGITMDDGKALTIEAFGDTFKRKIRDSGIVLNAMKQAQDVLGRRAKNMSVDDYAAFAMAGVVPKSQGVVQKAGEAVGEALSKAINRDVPNFQNNIIKLMISNLSTTALNVAGYTAMTALNSATDITRAVLLGGAAGLKLVTNPAEAKKLGISALGIIQNQMTKMSNILDPNTTYDTFLQYSQVRPEAMRQLISIDSIGPKGLDMSRPIWTMKMDQVVDVVQKLNFVQAQDGYTKAFEFTSQLDKLLRRSEEDGGFNMSWNEFFAQKDHPAKMMSMKFAALEAIAVDDTLKATLGKSYAGPGVLGEVASIIENARNIPFIGLLVPFGKFFNNTIATAHDLSAVGPMLSAWTGGQKTKFTSEVFAKGLVSWGLITTLAFREKDFMDMGLAWNEEIDPETGAVLDQRYSFPYGALKAVARIAAHIAWDVEAPKTLITQIQDQFIGQLTRQLGDTGTGFANIATALLSDEGQNLGTIISDLAGASLSQAVSGMTRPLEPLNTLVGLSRDEQYYTPDRKQGNKIVNNSLRYMDQFIALFAGGNASPPKYTSAEGKPRTQGSRLVSTTRETYLTDTERVMNMIGKPTWKQDMASLSDAADNRYNQLFHQIVEVGAAKLLQNPNWKKGDLEVRQDMFANLVESAQKGTKGYMGRLAANSGDRALLKMIDISSAGMLQIKRAMSDLAKQDPGFEKDFGDLSEEQLDVLEGALKYREEFKLGEIK